MKVSVIVPAYCATTTIGRTLSSLCDGAELLPENWGLEVIVVDDGSPDGDALNEVVARYPQVYTRKHDRNLGMCAARNTGIVASTGDIVTILDADDEFVDRWPERLGKVLSDWPDSANVCFAACVSPTGSVTAEHANYHGWLTTDDLLNERYSGEYLPIFSGAYIRAKRYVDLGLRKSCGIVSYLRLSQDGPFWVSPITLRVYHTENVGSVSQDWLMPCKAKETVICYDRLFRDYGALYRTRAPTVYKTKLLRYSVYRRFARLSGAFKAWKKGASWTCWKESLVALIILMLGRGIGSIIISSAKQRGFIRRYG